MKIFAVNYYNQNINQTENSQNKLKLALFLKHDTVCFKGKDLLDLPEEEVFKQIKDSINQDNFIGKGTDAEVYRIKDTKYCIRIPYGAEELYQFDYSKNLTPVDKVNHTVARLGFGASIMKYIDGVLPNSYIKNEQGRHKMQSNIARMPLKSFSKFLHQIANAFNNNMIFDSAGGNLIVNKKKKSLTAIDFFYVENSPKNEKPLSKMFQVLTCYGAKPKTEKKIFNKIIKSALKEFKAKKVPCMDLELFDFTDLCLKHNCENNSKDYYKFITETLEPEFNTLKDIKKTEINDSSASKQLKKQLKNIKKMIKLIR